MGGTHTPQATFMITKRITPAKTMRNAGKAARLLRGTLVLFAAAFVSFLAVPPGSAQESVLDKGPAPPYMEPEPPATPVEPTHDPLRANNSVELGSSYLQRGNHDAAIGRLRDATRFERKLGRGEGVLGEAYERKGDVDSALA